MKLTQFLKTILFFLGASSAACAAGPYNVYVPNFGVETGQTISIIDTATDTAVVVTVDTLGQGPFQTLVLPSGKKVYTINGGGGSVSVYSVETGGIKEIGIPGNARENWGALTFLGDKLYVTLVDNTTLAGTVAVIDTHVDVLIALIPVGTDTEGIAVSPNDFAFAANNYVGPSSNVSVIDTTTDTLIGTVDTGDFPFQVVATPTTTLFPGNNFWVYVTDRNLDMINSVSAINADTLGSVITITLAGVDDQGLYLAVTNDSRFVYVAGLDANQVFKIDTSTNTLVNTITVSGTPTFCAIRPDDAEVYVSCQTGNNVVVIDPISNVITHTIPVGAKPFFMAITPDNAKVYVANSGDSTVSVIDTTTYMVTTTITSNVGPTPGFLSIGQQFSPPICPCPCPDGIATCNSFHVWFVDNSNQPGPGTGTYANPFNTLKAAQNASSPCDVIYVFPGNGSDSGMNQGIILQDNQKLLGTTKEAFGLCPAAAGCGNPTITNSAFGPDGVTPVIVLANNNQIAGLNIDDFSSLVSGTGSIAIANKPPVAFNTSNFTASDLSIFIPITNCTLTDCNVHSHISDFLLFKCPNVGNVDISGCHFTLTVTSVSGDIIAGGAIDVIGCGNGTVNFTNNLVTGDENNVMLAGFALVGASAPMTVNVINNIFNSALSNTGLTIVSGVIDPTSTPTFGDGPIFAFISKNEISIQDSPVPDDTIVGIELGAVTQVLTSTVNTMTVYVPFIPAPLCARIYDNICIIPSDSAAPFREGYLFLNQTQAINPDTSEIFVPANPNLLRVDLNNGNSGSIATSAGNETNAFFPVGTTTDCSSQP